MSFNFSLQLVRLELSLMTCQSWLALSTCHYCFVILKMSLLTYLSWPVVFSLSISICHSTFFSHIVTLCLQGAHIGRKKYLRSEFFSFFSNFGRKKVGILRKSGNFLKYLNSFPIMEQNDVKIKHLLVSLGFDAIITILVGI